jgi:hypothetical protein
MGLQWVKNADDRKVNMGVNYCGKNPENSINRIKIGLEVTRNGYLLL